MSRRLAVAVVGLGIGRSHLDAYSALPELYQIKALCDLDVEKARAVAATVGQPMATANFADLLGIGGLDIIDICTPPNTHRSLIEQALGAGFHVICEKPLTGSLADVDAIGKAAAGAKGKNSSCCRRKGSAARRTSPPSRPPGGAKRTTIVCRGAANGRANSVARA
jgi:predicted dehydrogenase